MRVQLGRRHSKRNSIFQAPQAFPFGAEMSGEGVACFSDTDEEEAVLISYALDLISHLSILPLSQTPDNLTPILTCSLFCEFCFVFPTLYSDSHYPL